ncbi:MAG: class II fructose-bisphosphate aldolase [Victivallaceae bacterium]|nr:class II fructose-bisphosphate aldolase [Victivallaceae bacterium]
MSLVNLNAILPEAKREKRAIAAFNISNYETALAVINAAEAEKRPVVLQVYARLFVDQRGSDLAGCLERLAHRAGVPVALHLDHGDNVGQVKAALASGYTSVMYDGSCLPFDENVRIARFTADYAHKLGASAEGEIGHVSAAGKGVPTGEEEAEAFVRQTGVDALSIAIGTAHGYYPSAPAINLDLCAAIAARLPDLPLVLHGATDTPREAIREAVRLGVAKVNIATEFQDVFLKAVRSELNSEGDGFRPIDEVFAPAIFECTEFARSFIHFLAE